MNFLYQLVFLSIIFLASVYAQVTAQELTLITQEEQFPTIQTNSEAIPMPTPTQAPAEKSSPFSFENLPKLSARLTTSFNGSFEEKNQARKKQEQVCQDKLQEMKTYVEVTLKRTVMNSTCSESELIRVDAQNARYESEATTTFY
jgi:DNA anti-recombination protein RmuC